SPWSFVGGGQSNEVDGDASFIGGGANNLADADFAVIGGGSGNNINGPYSAIGGGIGNSVSASRSFVGGGESNEALGDYATVSGGQGNTALGDRSFVGGGSGNEAIGDYASVGGGRNNIAQENYSFIGGGEFNDATGAESFIGNGNDNLASGFRSFVGGGAENASSGDYSSILGGYYNTAHSYGETAIGLYTETYTPQSTTAFNANDRLFVVGNGTGTSTSARSNALTILKDGRTGLGTSSPQAKLHVQDGEVLMEGTWGIFNYSGPLSATGSGTRLMWIPGKAAFRVGRVVSDKWDLNNMGEFSAVVGGEENKASGNYTFVGGGTRNTASGNISFVGGGKDNTAIGDGSFVGGFGNVALNDGEIKLGLYSVASTSSTANPNNNTLFSLGNGDFYSPSNAFTILKDGRTVIGGSDPGGYRLKVIQTGSYGINLENTNGADWEWFVDGAGNLALYQNNVYKGAFNAASGTYTATSDARLKTAVAAMPSVMDRVMQLRPSQYQYKQDARGRRYLGFIAQEVEPLFPELVRAPDPNSERESYYTLDYSGFGIVAIKAIQEQQAVIETQQARIDALESQLQALQALEARLTQLEAAVQP
ncbi:MAG: tail fiber domain-containing protein, partial [Bacteroidia bacterium]|nr:tail fiber domain-containing protein [Bacteroidia bacterium]